MWPRGPIAAAEQRLSRAKSVQRCERHGAALEWGRARENCLSAKPAILIVDDDPRIREVVRYALSKEGFETVEAGGN